MKTLLINADVAVLNIVAPQREISLRRAACCVLIGGAIYGAAMGSYGIDGARWPQVLWSAIKVPVLLGLSGALSLPTFAVLYALWGLRDEFMLILRALLRTQAILSLVLASLSPLILLCYASMGDIARNYRLALGVNFGIFAIAAFVAQMVFRASCGQIMKRDSRHRWLLGGWIWVYGFIAFQMAWVLRPFIGDPNSATSFFRADALSNAYVALWNWLF